jgi:hypothetical protein
MFGMRGRFSGWPSAPELIDGRPRIIDAESEWSEPTWLYDGFDAMDYGLEVTTDSGAAFPLTWDPPG